MNKRHVSILIPYYENTRELFIFLQKRSNNAKRLPGFFGFFGGGVEDLETPEMALEREIEEELDIEISDFVLFSHYEFYGSKKDVFILKVSSNFIDTVNVKEGDFAKKFNEDELRLEKMLIDEDRLILSNFFGKMKRGDPFTRLSK